MARILLILILILTAGYSAYWWVGSSAQQSAMTAWLEARRADGWVADYESLDVRGYPSRFDTRIEDFTLADPQSRWAWSAPVFQILALSYQPNHIIAVWPPEQTVASPEERIEVTAGDMRASVKFEPNTALALDALTMDMDNVALVSNAGWTSSLDTAKFATRQTEGTQDAHDVWFEAQQMKPARILRNIVDPAGRLPEVFDRVKIDATLGFDAPWDRHAIEGRKPEFTQIALNDVTAVWGELAIEAAGTVTVDSLGYPSGKISVRARNWRQMLEVAVDSGLIPADLRSTLEGGLGLLARLSGNPDTIDVPLTFTNRVMTLGPIPIGRAPQLRINPQ